MKFDAVARFCKRIPTVKSVLLSEILKNFGFGPKLPFYPFLENWIFLGFHNFNVCSNLVFENINSPGKDLMLVIIFSTK